MHKPESILENEMDKILGNFEIQKDQQIPARTPDLVIINKKKRELAVAWILPSQQSREWKSKKAKIDIST